MGKIKLHVAATVEEAFKELIASRKTKGLAEKTLVSYQSQFRAVARHLDVSMDIPALQKTDLDGVIACMRDSGLSAGSSIVVSIDKGRQGFQRLDARLASSSS